MYLLWCHLATKHKLGILTLLLIHAMRKTTLLCSRHFRLFKHELLGLEPLKLRLPKLSKLLHVICKHELELPRLLLLERLIRKNDGVEKHLKVNV